MPRSFSWPEQGSFSVRSPRFWLQTCAAVLLILNLAVIYFYLFPPGGTRKELQAESTTLRSQIGVAGKGAARVENVAAKVESGSREAAQFANTYFMPKRIAYDSVLSEIQRMAKDSGVQSREAVFSEEAIEGSPDLSVMNVTANFEGTYDNLMKFLYQVDKSPTLLMLDTFQAAPQQHGNVVNASIRFQAIIRDDASLLNTGGQQQ